jgi:hypothetical protein
MINEAFGNRELTENLTLDWRLNAIFDSRSTRVGLAARKSIFSYSPFNLISQIPELYSGLSYSRYGLTCQAESLLTRMLCQPRISAKNKADLGRIERTFKMARISLVAYYLVANFLFGPIVAYFSQHIGYETEAERKSYSNDSPEEPSHPSARGQLQHVDGNAARAQKKSRQQGIALEIKALARLKESWKTKGEVADAALVESLAETTDAALEDLTYKVQQIRADNGRVHGEMKDLTDKVRKVHTEMKMIKASMSSELQCIKDMLERVVKVAEDGPA